MRTIEQTGQFRRDFKREAKGPLRQTLQSQFAAVITDLANDRLLAEKHRLYVSVRIVSSAFSGAGI